MVSVQIFVSLCIMSVHNADESVINIPTFSYDGDTIWLHKHT